MIIATSLYCFFEVFYDDVFGHLFHYFYKQRDVVILKGLSVSFFIQTYFAAHVYLMLMCFSLAFCIRERSGFWFLLYCLSWCLLVFVQSKTGIVSGIVATLFITFIGASALRSLLLIGLLVLVAVFLISSGLLEGFYIWRSTVSILEGRSGSLNVRLEQVVFAFETVEKHWYLLGAGVGRDLYLESWVSSVLYRYGLVGLIVYIFFWLYLVFYSFKVYCLVRLHNQLAASLSLGAAGWFLIIPIVSISSNVLAIPKNAFFVFFVYGCLCAIKKFRHLYEPSYACLSPSRSQPL